ncbi:hypothetical protein HMPREF3201_00060 [Megasphaera sp. MJR8396C]|mgnify:FL=1|nr:hypothetical protein HMPREF3201_00060 [Megasphaera sp. MJR8396C]
MGKRLYMGEQMNKGMCIIPVEMWISGWEDLLTICGWIVERYPQEDKA